MPLTERLQHRRRPGRAILLSERGLPSLALHVVGILMLLMVAATGVWALSRRTSRRSADRALQRP